MSVDLTSLSLVAPVLISLCLLDRSVCVSAYVLCRARLALPDTVARAKSRRTSAEVFGRRGQQRITQPPGMLVQLCLWYATRRDHCSGELGMQATRPIRDWGDVTPVQHGACEEIEHQPVNRAPLALHEVVDEAVTAELVGV